MSGNLLAMDRLELGQMFHASKGNRKWLWMNFQT